MNITVIGAGYVGLVAAVCLSEHNLVTCVDIDESRVQRLSAGDPIIHEKGLHSRLQESLNTGSLHFSTKYNSVGAADVVFIAVGTPEAQDGSADILYVLDAATSLVPHLCGTTLVVVKSTVPPGTCAQVEKILEGSGTDVQVAFNPEFLREGVAVRDFICPDRIVIGARTDKAFQTLVDLYHPLCGEVRMLYMSVESAELAKYAANTVLASRISLINEIARISEKVGANVDDVSYAVGTDSRIGTKFLQAGVGFGGSCFPKDVRALSVLSDNLGLYTPIIDSILPSNTVQTCLFAERVVIYLESLNLENPKVGVWGLAFKPGTDDYREAPSLKFIQHLNAVGYEVIAYDPIVDTTRYAESLGVQCTFARSLEATCAADVIVVLTEWPEFESRSRLIENHSTIRAVFDGRNMFDPTLFPTKHYERIGQ